MSAAFYPLSVIMGVECGSVAACCADNTCQDELSCDQEHPFSDPSVYFVFFHAFFRNCAIFDRTDDAQMNQLIRNYENLGQIMYNITQGIHRIMV